MKHPKQAFGIHEDGIAVKFAHLVNVGNVIYLQALERVELDAPLYRRPDEKVDFETESNPWDSEAQTDEEVKLDEFNPEFGTGYQIQPCDQLLSSYDLKQGVIALNVNSDNLIIKQDGTLPNKKAVRQFIKGSISAEDYKKGNWELSTVKVNGRPQLWVHHGTNQLLEILIEYHKKMKVSMFFQLADANDIALTDFFRLNLDKDSERIVLVHIGLEYRRIFVFENGNWVDTHALQISQPNPNPEIIYSKLSLVLDEAQLGSIRKIVFCGDLASQEVVDFAQSQYEEVAVELFRFSQVVISEDKSTIWDLHFLAQYVLPIALAYKALYIENKNFTPSNFLPFSILEGQKVFKIAWHGFIVLGFLFVLTSLGTYRILIANLELIQSNRTLKQKGEELLLKKEEAKEIDRINEEIASQQQGLVVIRSLLEGKNPWSELLSRLITELNAHPMTWLTNLRKEGNGIFVSGVTSRQANVVSLANVLPMSRINKVVHTLIRDRNFWSFEIVSQLPEVDWIGLMESEIADLVKPKTPDEQPAPQSEPPKTVAPAKPAVSLAPAPKPKQTEPVKMARPINFGIRPIDEIYLLRASDEMVESRNRPDVRAYWQFIDAVRKGNMWAYQDYGAAFLQEYPESPLQPIVRWRLAYRYYVDRELDLSWQYVSPMLQQKNSFSPHTLLLAGRIELARKNAKYSEYYNALRKDHPAHPLIELINKDLTELNK